MDVKMSTISTPKKVEQQEKNNTQNPGNVVLNVQASLNQTTVVQITPPKVGESGMSDGSNTGSPEEKRLKRNEKVIDKEIEDFKEYLEKLSKADRKACEKLLRSKLRDKYNLKDDLEDSIKREGNALKDKDKLDSVIYSVK